MPDALETQLFERLVDGEVNTIATLLKAKNKKYGNSALSPAMIFSKAPAIEQIKIRIDDKLKRIASGFGNDINAKDATAEDTIADLLGYLIIYRIALRWDDEVAKLRR
jgi:hypothetical protein